MPLVIIGWDDNYENNRTRTMKKMEWVPIPNRMDGLGYATLVDHPNGAAHLGAWLAIVEIASKQDVRGTIPQEPAVLCRSLARISRLPADIFEEVLPRLVEVGWIQSLVAIPQEPAGKPHDGAEERLRARAGASVPFSSIPFSSVPSEEEKNKEELFQNVISAFLAAGVLLTDLHIFAARQEWDAIPPGEYPAALAMACDRARKNDARFMGLPKNFLYKGDWRARGPGRILPEPMGKKDLAHDIAARNFVAKRKETGA